jgi:lipopolysaccharide export system ATP-binding protein
LSVFERPDEGSIRLNGEDISAQPMYQRARKGIVYLPQEPSVFRRLTVEDNILAILETRALADGERAEKLENCSTI